MKPTGRFRFLLPACFPRVIAVQLPFPGWLLRGAVGGHVDRHAMTGGINSIRDHPWTIGVQRQR